MVQWGGGGGCASKQEQMGRLNWHKNISTRLGGVMRSTKQKNIGGTLTERYLV